LQETIKDAAARFPMTEPRGRILGANPGSGYRFNDRIIELNERLEPNPFSGKSRAVSDAENNAELC